MSDQSGTPGAAPGGTGGRTGAVTLVDQGNLGPRTSEGSSFFGAVTPIFRFLYSLISKNSVRSSSP